jgi:YggT family protein
MGFVSTLMRIITALLSIYMLMIMFRILLSWFQGMQHGRAVGFIRSMTDPYLNWFRRFEFLRIGNIDFSPIVAIIVLSVLTSITGRLALAGIITFGLVLALLIARVGSAAGFFIVVFLILAIVRAIGSLAGVNTAARFWIAVDQILEPVVHRVTRVFARGRFVSYRNALVIFAATMVVVLLVGGWIVNRLVALAWSIPF